MFERTDRSLRFAARLEQRLRSGPPEVESASPASVNLDTLKKKFAAVISEVQAPPPISDTSSTSDVILRVAEETASLLSRFDPDELCKMLGFEEDKKSFALSRLVPLCSIEPIGNRTKWLLRVDRRPSVIGRLLSEERLGNALNQLLPKDDLDGEMLRNILHGKEIDVTTLDRDRLLAVSWALEALAGLPIRKPDIEDVQHLLARSQFLREYSVLLEKGFVGRESELLRLTAFLERPTTQRASLLVTGLGGSGKSSLLAKFATDTVTRKKAVVTVIDFDRPGIDPQDTLSIEMEIARQVGSQISSDDRVLRRARENVRLYSSDQRQFQATFASESLESARGFRANILSTLANTIRNANQPLLLILDTFEEVAQRDLTFHIFDWLRDVESIMWQVPLRVIISGRLFDNAYSMVKAQVNEVLVVGEFDYKTSYDFLVGLGVTRALASKLASSDILPHRPLELKLLSKVVGDSTTAEIKKLEQELRDGGAAAKELFAGLVYRRVLLRVKVFNEPPGSVINDGLLRSLAYPGLVLRYVTSELIQKVLVPALGLPQLDEGQARQVLDLLSAHEWLATRTGDSVWHRRDLRRSVLKPMIAENRDRATAIHKLAIQYFQSAAEERDRAEAFYHRLMMLSPEETLEFEIDELRKAGPYFEADRLDLPPAGNALLGYVLKGDVAIIEIASLPKSVREVAYQKKGEDLVNSREFQSALSLYCPNRAPLAGWERTTLFATAEWEKLRTRLAHGSLPSDWQEFGDFVLAASVTKSMPDQRLLEQFKEMMSKDSHMGTGSSTLLRSVVVGLVMILDGQAAPPEIIDDLRQLIQIAEKAASVDEQFGKRLILLRLKIGGTANVSLPIGPSTIQLNPVWLEQAASSFGPSAKVPKSAIDLFMKASDILKKGVAGQRSVRGLLSQIQQLRSSDPIVLEQINSSSLWRYLWAPNPEFRDPARFAIISDCLKRSSFRALAETFRSLIPFQVDDFEPAAFTRELSVDPEHSLEPLIELADRAGVLETLLRRVIELAPQGKKLRSVLDASRSWSLAVARTLLTP